MSREKKYYFGNNPLSKGYDETIPPGYNRWDLEEDLGREDEVDEQIDEPENEIDE